MPRRAVCVGWLICGMIDVIVLRSENLYIPLTKIRPRAPSRFSLNNWGASCSRNAVAPLGPEYGADAKSGVGVGPCCTGASPLQPPPRATPPGSQHYWLTAGLQIRLSSSNWFISGSASLTLLKHCGGVRLQIQPDDQRSPRFLKGWLWRSLPGPDSFHISFRQSHNGHSRSPHSPQNYECIEQARDKPCSYKLFY